MVRGILHPLGDWPESVNVLTDAINNLLVGGLSPSAGLTAEEKKQQGRTDRGAVLPLLARSPLLHPHVFRGWDGSGNRSPSVGRAGSSFPPVSDHDRARLAPTRSDPVRPRPLRSNPARSQPAPSNPVQSGPPIPSGLVRSGPIRFDFGRARLIRSDAVRPRPVPPNPVKSCPIPSGPARSGPIRSDPAGPTNEQNDLKTNFK